MSDGWKGVWSPLPRQQGKLYPQRRAGSVVRSTGKAGVESASQASGFLQRPEVQLLHLSFEGQGLFISCLYRWSSLSAEQLLTLCCPSEGDALSGCTLILQDNILVGKGGEMEGQALPSLTSCCSSNYPQSRGTIGYPGCCSHIHSFPGPELNWHISPLHTMFPVFRLESARQKSLQWNIFLCCRRTVSKAFLWVADSWWAWLWSPLCEGSPGLLLKSMWPTTSALCTSAVPCPAMPGGGGGVGKACWRHC